MITIRSISKLLIERRWWEKNASEYLQERDKLKLLERMQNYRGEMKNDPAKYAQYLNKEKQRYKKREKTGEQF